MKDHIKILGLIYKITEAERVNKEELRKGEINFLTNEIRIDKNMPDVAGNRKRRRSGESDVSAA